MFDVEFRDIGRLVHGASAVADLDATIVRPTLADNQAQFYDEAGPHRFRAGHGSRFSKSVTPLASVATISPSIVTELVGHGAQASAGCAAPPPMSPSRSAPCSGGVAAVTGAGRTAREA